MDLSSFKDPELARGLIHSIEKWAPEHATLMEVCGTHTVAIARNGLRTMMPEGVRLASGPGCPVCVTSNKDIDTLIACSGAHFSIEWIKPRASSGSLKEDKSIEIVRL